MLRRSVHAAAAPLAALLLLTASPGDAAAQTPLTPGVTVAGLLTDDDLTLPDESKYDEFTYRGRRGEHLDIVLRSSEFDAYLLLGRGGADGAWVTLAEDDDGAGGTDARIRFTLPDDGVYEIRANALHADGRGGYTLRLDTGESPPALDATPAALAATRAAAIAVGETVTGTLAEGDDRLEDDSFYDSYRFQGRAGERVTITMRSADFDAFLLLGRIEGGEWTQLATDDDGAGGTDAAITFVLPADGDYLIRANSLGADQVGSYTLELRRGGE